MRILLIAVLSLTAWAQTAQWPTTVPGPSDIPAVGDAAVSTLNGGINDSTPTVIVADGSRFRQYQIIRVGTEKMLITNISTNTLTVTRGYDSSTPAAHSNGALVRGEFFSFPFNKIRAELLSMAGNMLPGRSGTGLPGACNVTPREVFLLTTTNVLYGCNGTGNGWTAITSAATGASAYIASITVSTGSYALAESTHGRGMWPVVSLWNSSGVEVDAGIALDSPGIDGDLTLTLENGTYFVSVEPGDSSSAYTASITVSAGSYAIAGSAHLRGKWPRVVMWTDAGVQVTPGVTLDNPDVNGDLTLTATNGDYFVSVASGSETVESGGGGANADGYYLVSRATNAPANAVNLGALSSGVLKVTVAGGVATPAVVSGTSTNCVLVDGTSGACGSGTTYTAGASGGVTVVGSVIDIDTAIVPRKADAITWTGLHIFAGSSYGTPASASATCTAGTWMWDANYEYRCVATNTWKRAALSTW